MPFIPFLHKAINRENFSTAEAQSAMELLLQGHATTAQIAAFLTALRMKGETPDELAGFARAMRVHAVPVNTGITNEPVLDTCGTGGDSSCTFNISTAAAFVVAGAGVKVAKHGNKSISSHCGSADILEALGVNLLLTADQCAAAIRDVGIGFLYAPSIHPAMRHAQTARKELKLRTVFNLLGPLTNPAGASAQLVGAPSVRAAELMAEALASLGLRRGFVVHGMDGLDEITSTSETLALEIHKGAIAHHTLTPEDFGVPRAKLADLRSETLEENKKIILEVLGGDPGPRRDIVLMNASAALVACGRTADFLSGMQMAALAVDTGAAQSRLDALISFSHSPQPLQAA